MTRLTQPTRFLAASILAFAVLCVGGLSSTATAAGPYAPAAHGHQCRYKTVTKWTPKKVPYVKKVTLYKPCGTPYCVYKTYYKTVWKPVTYRVKVCCGY